MDQDTKKMRTKGELMISIELSSLRIQRKERLADVEKARRLMEETCAACMRINERITELEADLAAMMRGREK